jgi:sarcosine oxidase, subunit gamma
MPFLTMVGLRVLPQSAAASRLEARLGAALPSRCGAVGVGEGVSVLWLSPDEFLAVSEGPQPGLVAALAGELEGEPGSVVDLSANRTTFELVGPMAREVLEKGCPFDLHPRVFTARTAFVTTIGHVPAIVWKTDEQVYRVLPRASFADFLGRWLLDAMAEFQAPEIP